MGDAALSKALIRALLALRITLGLFLLQWGIEKFIVPQSSMFIWEHFYGVAAPPMLGYAFGIAEIAIALCMILGVFRTIVYGAALFLHTVTVLVTWRQLIDPWGDPINHLFTAAVPVLGGFLALFLLRRWDRSLLEK
jgi:uncharacterized membrane protein YphA (DoxX/SURF4 family)